MLPIYADLKLHFLFMIIKNTLFQFNILSSRRTARQKSEFMYLHSVQGQSGFFNLVLTERNMQVKYDLKLSVYSLGLEIWLLSFKFNFGLMGWPQQPPRERVPKFNKIVGFWWSISHWETRIDHFGAMVDGNIKVSNLLCDMRLLRSLRPQIF